VPVIERKRVRAVLLAGCRQPNGYTARHADAVASLAAGALPALDRALLQVWLRQIEAPVEIVGVSTPFLELERQVKDIGCFSTGSVLITGERGAGKELVAWAIHGWSRRRSRSFVPVLVSACADGLLCDELFGHEPHAFTGAGEERPGKFRAAEGGTLFLDEAADLPAPVQSALLRVLERGELQRLGRDEPLRVDVRVAAATSRDLPALIAERSFRPDLLDRLSLLEVRVPPLRERPEDIPLLARQFLRAHCHAAWRSHSFARENACAGCASVDHVCCATPEFFAALKAYSWPGNIRELKHLMVRLVASVPDEVLDVRHLPAKLHAALGRQESEPRGDAPAHLTLDSAIRTHIREVLRSTGYNQSEAARLLGIPLSTLRSKMKKLDLPLASGRRP
jgi:two-component system response regulator HydG